MKKLSISISLLIALACMNFVPLQANAPICHTTNGNPYCSYRGKVIQAYINHVNVILLYFDTPFDPAVASSVGLTISGNGTSVAAFPMTETNKLFGQSLYATMLSALTADKTVSIQMRGNYGGYLMVDRIWIHKD